MVFLGNGADGCNPHKIKVFRGWVQKSPKVIHKKSCFWEKSSVFGKLFGKLPEALFFLGKLRGSGGNRFPFRERFWEMVTYLLFGSVLGNVGTSFPFRGYLWEMLELYSLFGDAFGKARWPGAEGGGVGYAKQEL